MIEGTFTGQSFVTVFVAMHPGIYQFVEHSGNEQEFSVRRGHSGDYDVEAKLVGVTGQYCFVLYLEAGHVLRRRGGDSKLSGVRLGDEL